MILAVLGASLVIELAKFENASLIPSLIVMGIGSAGLIFLELYRRKTTPEDVIEEEKKVSRAWLGKGQFLEFDIGFVVFLTGMIAEYLSFSALYQRLFAVAIYILLSYALYVKYRKRVPTSQWAFFFHLGFILTMPIIAFTWRFPEALSEIGVVNIYDSRRISYLTFLYLQIGLLISTTISSSRSWRTVILIKKKLSNKDLMYTQRDFLAAVEDENLRENLREIVADVAILRETVISGQFQATIGWGWSILSRVLGKLSHEERELDRAKELNLLTENFRKCYNIRNKTVHEGYTPNFDEACSFLTLVKEVSTSLSSLSH